MSNGNCSSVVGGNWNSFFSSLAFAEKAAENQCKEISGLFENLGMHNLAKEYSNFASEENSHYQLASAMCFPLQPPTAKAEQVYLGNLMNQNASVFERMACVHLVFEPAALAFLGYIRNHINELLDNPMQAKIVEENCRAILCDEIAHVYQGKDTIRKQLHLIDADERVRIKKSVRRHRAFLVAGLKSFFRNEGDKKFLDPMLRRFHFYFNKSNEGLF